MRDSKSNTCERNLHPIQNHEIHLRPHRRPSPPSRHLTNPVNTPDQNRHIRKPHRLPKPPKLPVPITKIALPHPLLLPNSSHPLPPPPTIIPNHNTKHHHRRHLQRNPRHNQIIPRLRLSNIPRPTRTRRYRGPHRLHDNRNHITPHEHPRIPLRPNPTIPLATPHNHMLQRQIYPCGEETRRDDETRDLDALVVLVPGVVVQEEAADVADEFAEEADRDEEGEIESALEVAEEEVHEEENAEEEAEDGVAGEVGAVAVEGCLDGAGGGDVGAVGGHGGRLSWVLVGGRESL